MDRISLRVMMARFQPQKYRETRWCGWIIPLLFLGVQGCSLERHLQGEDQLLVKNEIVWKGMPSLDAAPDGATSVIRQPANRQLLGLRIPLFIHGLIRPEKLERAEIKRLEAGREGKGLRHWIAHNLGEPPVIFDAEAKERTERNLEALSRRAGYLNADCSAELEKIGTHAVALIYSVRTGPLWTLSSVSLDVEGSGMLENEIEGQLSILEGDVFDADRLELERAQLARYLKSKGYASLDETHISFKADTSSRSGSHTVALTVEISPAKYSAMGTPVAHRRSRFRDIEWLVDSLSKPISEPVLDHLISIEPGMRYNEGAIETTYRRLMQLPSIARVEIPGSLEFVEGPEDAFDVSIKLIQRPRYGISAALDMTRTNARYGPVITGVFTDRNVSGRGDMLDFSLSGGITSSQPFSYTVSTLVPNSGAWSIEAHYSTLGIPPIALSRLRASNAARTDFTGLWSRESRPEYARNSVGFKHGFHFVENPDRESRISVDLIELTYAKIDLGTDFQAWLDNESNPFIQYRFQDYASVLSRLRWTSRWAQSELVFGTVNVGVEWTGWGLNALAPTLGLKKNEDGQFLLGQVPFVQFLRCEGSWTGAWVLNPMSGTSLHARFHAGAGWAGENFNALPFDRSFFTGSANGIRGWPARQLGPGHTGYDIDALNVVKGLGDLLGEVSLEVRKQTTNMIEWAWFMDVGNVWLMKQPLLEDALSDTRLEWSSLGFSSGIGIRLDFDFFLLRLDGGLRIHDPGLEAGQRWFSQHKTKGGIHLGIGHPF